MLGTTYNNILHPGTCMFTVESAKLFVCLLYLLDCFFDILTKYEILYIF